MNALWMFFLIQTPIKKLIGNGTCFMTHIVPGRYQYMLMPIRAWQKLLIQTSNEDSDRSRKTF